MSRRRGVHPGAVLAVAALVLTLSTPEGRAVLTGGQLVALLLLAAAVVVLVVVAT